MNIKGRRITIETFAEEDGRIVKVTARTEDDHFPTGKFLAQLLIEDLGIGWAGRLAREAFEEIDRRVKIGEIK